MELKVLTTKKPPKHSKLRTPTKASSQNRFRVENQIQDLRDKTELLLRSTHEDHVVHDVKTCNSKTAHWPMIFVFIFLHESDLPF